MILILILILGREQLRPARGFDMNDEAQKYEEAIRRLANADVEAIETYFRDKYPNPITASVMCSLVIEVLVERATGAPTGTLKH